MDMLQEVIEFLRARNVPAYLVGGWVRDRFLDRLDNRDVDLALEGDAIGLARAFANQHGGAFYLMDQEHGVARALFGKTYVDFAVLRGDITADLALRDFTINAMALPISAPGLADAAPETLAQFLIDPFHGWDDLQAHLVRAVSEQVFRNDPVRLLRGLRLVSSLGFAVELQTAELMRRDAALLATASMERARDELFKILAQRNAVALLLQMDDLGLLAALLPEVTRLKGIAQPPPHVFDVFEHSLHTAGETVRIQTNGYADVGNGEFASQLLSHFDTVVSGERTRATLLRLIGLLHDIGKFGTQSVDGNGRIHFYGHEMLGVELAEGIFRRLRMSNAEQSLATRTIDAHLRPPQLAREPRVSNRAVYRFFRDTRDAGVDVCVLALADTRAKELSLMDPSEYENIQETLSRLLTAYYNSPDVIISPPRLIDGSALMRELHLPAGPLVGELLERIREAQADGEIFSREHALEFARDIVRGGKRQSTDG